MSKLSVGMGATFRPLISSDVSESVRSLWERFRIYLSSLSCLYVGVCGRGSLFVLSVGEEVGCVLWGLLSLFCLLFLLYPVV